MSQEYEVIIVGGGPAGLTAGLYSSRARIKTLLIEKGLLGGLMVIAEWIENYPGHPEGISGADLGKLMQEQATKYGLETVYDEVTGLEVNGKKKIVKTMQGSYQAEAVIIAGGSERQKLNIPGEAEFIGRGVSYCATCDAAFFQDLPVAVVGGGDSAIAEALHLAKFASRVYLIHRRDQLRATKIMQEKAFAESRITPVLSTVVEEIKGTETVGSLNLRNVKDSKKSDLDVAGIFIATGFKPNTDYLKDILKLGAGGTIITNDKMETEVPGILAAGDIRFNSGRQVIIAAGDGATAAIYAEKHLSG